MRAFFACVIACLCSAPAGAVVRERLIGLATVDEIALIAVEDDTLGTFVKACTYAASGEMSLGWLAPPAGSRCAEVTEAAAGRPVAEATKNLLGKSKTVKGPLWGLKVSAEPAEGGTVVVVSGGAEADGAKSVRSAVIPGEGPLKIADVQSDELGVIVAATLEGGPNGQRAVVVVNVAATLVGPPGQRFAAGRLKAAEAAMKKRDWSGAKALLEVAEAADPTSAAVRYARAQAEAQAGIGTTTMIECLRWLKEQAAREDAPTQAKDARRFLEQAKKDRAFDAWAGEPELRELIGLPALASMTPEARLLERTATFSRQGRSCENSWLTLTFQKGGKGTLAIAWSCKGKKMASKQPFTWAMAGATVTFQTAAKELTPGTTRKGDLAGETIPATATLELDGTYQQVRLSDGGNVLGPFEPGPALIDDAL